MFSVLFNSFESFRENLSSFHAREKDRNDLGAVERVFKANDKVRVRIKSRQSTPAKYASG